MSARMSTALSPLPVLLSLSRPGRAQTCGDSPARSQTGHSVAPLADVRRLGYPADRLNATPAVQISAYSATTQVTTTS